MFHRILHIALAISVLLSTTGISVHRHFCQDKLMGTTMFFKPHGCKMNTHKACHTASHCAKKTDQDCCKDQSEYHKLEQDKQISLVPFKLLKQPIQLSLPWPAIVLPAITSTSQILPYLHYRPPLIRGTLPALLQVFRF
ncbi:MAG: hypothetical protein H6569_15370 [Lewinellaceae bacterium]|nr:hypothetical protein [Lewinellaceae bacterium]